MMLRGIDVSTHQGDIDWSGVRASGINFAMIKATHGRSVTGTYRDFTDSKFVQNIIGANRNGIRVGVYHYLTAQSVAEAMHEAEYFLSVIDPYKSIIDLYAAVDVEEDKYLPLDKTLLTQIVYTFCSRVQAAGYAPIIYTNPNYLTYRLGDVSKYPLWLALWRNKTIVPTVQQYPNLRMWQWGSETVGGINGNVDANFIIAEKPEEAPEVPKSETEPPKSETEPPKSETEPQKSETEPPKSETVVKPAAPGKDNTASSWAVDAVKWCVDNKIVLGDQNGDLMLHQPMTREQACLVVKRVYDKIMEDAPERAAGAVARTLIDALEGE